MLNDNRKLAWIILTGAVLLPIYLVACGWWGRFVAENYWPMVTLIIVPLGPFWIAGVSYAIHLLRKN